MSQTLDQIYIANPSTTMQDLDLLYLVHSPYTAGQDSAIEYKDLVTSLALANGYIGSAFAGSLAYYSSTGQHLAGLTTPGTNSVLTSLSGNPQWNNVLPLAIGGTNASLTASTGGIFYSTASAAAILSGTATASLPLLSGSTAAPTWGAYALSLGGALTTAGAHTLSGAFASTFTFTNTTAVTFPTSGTLATTSQIPSITPAALTQANDTNVTLTLGGTPATALLQATSITAGWTGTLAGARGGLAAAITANNGGIYYSTASNGALLSGTATATQMLQSGASTTPAWSTTTWPATSTINQLLYSSAANTISGLATSTTAVLTTSAGVPTWAASLSLALGGTNAALAASNGGIFYSTASAGAILAGTATAKLPLLSGATAAPTWGAFALTMGGAITTAGALTTSGAFASTFTMTGTTTVTFPTSGTLATTAQIGNSWVDQASATVTMVTNTGYTADAGASLITFTLPTTSAIGDFVEINGKAAGLWKIAQAAGQQINISGGTATTSGTGGSIASVGQFDCVRLRCLTANTIWTVVSQQSAGLTVV